MSQDNVSGQGTKLTILGGGGFRVPLIYQELLRPQFRDLIDDVVLYDPDEQRLRVISAVVGQLAEECGAGPRVTATADLSESLRGATFVFSAIRVGGLAGRVADERISLSQGQLGQETVGAGGILYGMRTVPEMTRIAAAVGQIAPDAWLINLTNPAGLVTQVMSRQLGDRVIGICDSPAELCHHVAGVLDIEPDKAFFDYFGLNHLGWLRAVRVRGRDLLTDLLADESRLDKLPETDLFGADWLRALGMLPNEYLFYYYKNREATESIISSERTRGEFLRRQQEEFYGAALENPSGALGAWRAAQAERNSTYMAESRPSGQQRWDADESGTGYAKIALAVVRAIARDESDLLILNVRNRSALPLLPDDAVVEVPCVVTANGAMPLAVGEVPRDAGGLIVAVEAAQRTAIEAALAGSWQAALRAVAAHPLVHSVPAAQEILRRYRAELPRMLPSWSVPGQGLLAVQEPPG